MVLSSLIAFLVLILMVLLRPGSWKDRARVVVGASVIGVGVYFATNPYVLINLIRDPAVVRENLSALGKAKALVGESSDSGAISNAHRLIVEGASALGGEAALVAILIAAVDRRRWPDRVRARNVAILLGAPAAVVLIQFVLLAKGKPGEFGRFAILPDVALVLLVVAVVFSMRFPPAWSGPVFAAVVLMVALQGASYWLGFRADARRGHTSRDVAAGRLEDLWGRGARTLGVRADPAPYNLPPVDATKWRLILLRPDGTVGDGDAWPDVVIFPVDDVQPGGQVAGTPYVRSTVLGNRLWGNARISWADKAFEIRVQPRFAASAGPP